MIQIHFNTKPLFMYVVYKDFFQSFFMPDAKKLEHQPPPKPRPRTPQKASSLLVENLPEGSKSFQIELYLESLTGKKCKITKVKTPVAVIEMMEPIGK